MPTDPSLSPQTLNQYIRDEITELLHDNEVYELQSCGWIDADTHGPELVGHAMQQTDSFAWRFLLAAMDSPNPPQLNPWEKALAISGGDFEGLMEAARISIGLMLFQDARVGENLTAPDSFFSVHLMGAMFFLGAASDRLRDFFVSAVFHKITEHPRRRSVVITDYYNKGRFKNDKRSRYVTPFSEAFHDTLASYDDPIASSIAKLPALAEGLEKFRLLRNAIVHVIATEEGRLQEHIVNNPPHPKTDPDFEITDEMLKDAINTVNAALRARISTPIRWHQLLIEASNHVFIVENMLRRTARLPPGPLA
jgi:hypothetical protein